MPLNLYSFVEFGHMDMALVIIAGKKGGSVAEWLSSTKGLTTKVALVLIAAGEGRAVVDNLGSFEGLNHMVIVLALIEAGACWEVAENLDKFDGLNNAEVACALIEAGFGKVVVEYIGGFFEATLCDEPDALAAARLLAETPRETITSQEFEDLVQTARNVGGHKGKPRAAAYNDEPSDAGRFVVRPYTAAKLF